jgi:hypothetical protein
MKFVWSLFKKALSPILLIAGYYASKTPSPWDDQVVALARELGLKFIPGSADNGQWVGDPPMTNPDDKASAVRAITAIMLKEMFINPDFQNRAKLTPEQAGLTLVAALAYVKPDAVDQEAEILALLKDAAEGAVK